MRRVLPWPRSPSSTRSCPASSAVSSSGSTVSSKPTIPGNASSPARSRASRFSRISLLTLRWTWPEARSSPRVVATGVGVGHCFTLRPTPDGVEGCVCRAVRALDHRVGALRMGLSGWPWRRTRSGCASSPTGWRPVAGRERDRTDEVRELAAAVRERRVAAPARRPASSGGRDALGSDGRRLAPVEVVVPVLGVDGCSAGWVGALLEPGAPRPRIVVAPTIADLVAMVRESTGIRVVGIDIPIGLPDNTIRQADVLARQALPGKASSIFSTLTRSAYAAATRLEADSVNRGLVGQGVGAQAFALRDKIVEVDAWLRTRPTVTVLEVHPEVSFAAMTGAPIIASKKTDEGRDQRLEALAAAGIPRPSVLQGQGYAVDDVLDACAVAWSAARHASGLARPLPDPPEVFSDGIPAAIWA